MQGFPREAACKRSGCAVEFTDDSLDMPVPVSVSGDAGQMQKDSASPAAGICERIRFHCSR